MLKVCSTEILLAHSQPCCQLNYLETDAWHAWQLTYNHERSTMSNMMQTYYQHRVCTRVGVRILQGVVMCWLCGECVLGLCVCDNRDGWLVAGGLCGCMPSRFSTVWLLPFTLL